MAPDLITQLYCELCYLNSRIVHESNVLRYQTFLNDRATFHPTHRITNLLLASLVYWRRYRDRDDHGVSQPMDHAERVDQSQ